MQPMSPTSRAILALAALVPALASCNGAAQSLLVVEVAATPAVSPLARLRVRAGGVERLETGEVPQKVGLYLPSTFSGQVTAFVEGLDGADRPVARGMSAPVAISPGQTLHVSVSLVAIGPDGQPSPDAAASDGAAVPDTAGMSDGASVRDAAAGSDSAAAGGSDSAAAGGSDSATVPDTVTARDVFSPIEAAPAADSAASKDAAAAALDAPNTQVGSPGDCLPPDEERLALRITRANAIVAEFTNPTGWRCASRFQPTANGEKPQLVLNRYPDSGGHRVFVREVDILPGAIGSFAANSVNIGYGSANWTGYPGTCQITLTTSAKIGEGVWGSSILEVYKVAGSITCGRLVMGAGLSNDKLEQLDFVTRVTLTRPP